MASYSDPYRRLFLLHDDIDNAIADLLVEVALHLLFEVDDLVCPCAVFKRKVGVYPCDISASAGMDGMKLRISAVMLGQYIQGL